jgi:hypothetical protein
LFIVSILGDELNGETPMLDLFELKPLDWALIEVMPSRVS